MNPPALRLAVVAGIAAGCWGIWVLGGLALAWAGLDDLDPLGRIVFVFGYLTACQAVHERLSR